MSKMAFCAAFHGLYTGAVAEDNDERTFLMGFRLPKAAASYNSQL